MRLTSGGKLHRGVAPIAGSEDAQLAAIHEGLEPVLDGLELSGAVAGPIGEALGELSGLGRVGLERGNDVHPVQRREMVEMDQVILDGVLGDHEVAHELRVDRHLDLERVLDGADRADGMNGGADAAEPLRVGPGVLRITAFEDHLDAAPHLGRGPGLGDVVAVHFDVNSQMAFDAGDGV